MNVCCFARGSGSGSGHRQRASELKLRVLENLNIFIARSAGEPILPLEAEASARASFSAAAKIMQMPASQPVARLVSL